MPATPAAPIIHVFCRAGFLCARADGETNAGDVTFCPAASRLLASSPLHINRTVQSPTITSREDPTADPDHPVQHRYVCGATCRRIRSRCDPNSYACFKCICGVFCVFAKNVVAHKTGNPIPRCSDHQRLVVARSFGRGSNKSSFHLGSGAVALHSGRLVLVFGNADSGYRASSGRKTSYCRPLYICVTNWIIPYC